MRSENNETIKRPTGMLGFTLVWAGQLVSVLASSMTQFTLTIWAYQKTCPQSGGCATKHDRMGKNSG